MPKVINRAIHLRMFAGFSVLTTFSAPPQILAASTVFFARFQNEEMIGDGFLLVLLLQLF